MISSNAFKVWNTRHILLNNLENKHSLVMKSFVWRYERKVFIKTFYKNCDLETSFRLFSIFKESSAKKHTKKSANLDKFW